MSDFPKPEPATGKIQKICNEVKRDTEKKVLPSDQHFAEFAAMMYRAKSTGDSVIYLVKVFVGHGTYVHIRLKEMTASSVISFEDAQYSKKIDDPLEPF